MKVSYLASSPEGEFRLEEGDRALPFRIRPDKIHPTLTLGDYLDSLRDFVLQEETHPLCRVLSDLLHAPVTPADLQEIRIRMEKHGALYHVACAEPLTKAGRTKLALSAALSPHSRACLAREEERLIDLDRRYGLPFLPVPLLSGEIPCGSPETAQPLRILLVEWFEDFHEWHLDDDAQGGPARVHLWDSTGGYRFASESEARALFRGIARILTLHYDPDTFFQITSWHHAAGDFIVRTSAGPLEVRLTTVRGYEPLPGLGPEDGVHPLVALSYFLLNLLLRMRLDRREGVGQPCWAGEWAVRAVLEGFFGALGDMQKAGRSLPAEIDEIRGLLRSFSQAELLGLYSAVLDFAADEDTGGRTWLAGRLEEHVAAVHRALQET